MADVSLTRAADDRPVPKFSFETDAVSGVQLDRAMRLSRDRFPEIAIELLAPTHDVAADHVRWTCEAPSVDHVDRWATTAGLAVRSLRPLRGGL